MKLSDLIQRIVKGRVRVYELDSKFASTLVTDETIPKDEIHVVGRDGNTVIINLSTQKVTKK